MGIPSYECIADIGESTGLLPPNTYIKSYPVLPIIDIATRCTNGDCILATTPDFAASRAPEAPFFRQNPYGLVGVRTVEEYKASTTKNVIPFKLTSWDTIESIIRLVCT